MRELMIQRPNVLRKLIVIGLFFAGATSAVVAQSTYGTIVGTVTDPSGAVVRDATVTIIDTDRQTKRTVVTNAGGEYLVPNMLASRYRIRITDANFEELSITQLVLQSRQILRVDGVLHLGNVDQTVTISGSERGAITTDTATIQSRFSKNEVLALPANIRTNGNTSSFNLIRFLPGVEADSSGNYTIQGAGFSQTNFSLDGISTQDVTANAPLKSATISSESIAEIKVQAVGNNAEFGQVGDVTTLSRGGADDFHGDVFEYHTDRALNATPFAKAVKPQYIANDFGGTLSGPLRLPVLYSMRSHSFFLGTYEGFRNPVQQYVTNSVPTAAFRAGDFSAMSSSVKAPARVWLFPAILFQQTGSARSRLVYSNCTHCPTQGSLRNCRITSFNCAGPTT